MVQRRHINQRPFDETVCDPSIANGIVQAPPPMMKTVRDEGTSKYGPKNSCVCDALHTVCSYELFVIMEHNRNG